MFKYTEQFQKIKKELQIIGALDQYAVFECYIDSISTFGLNFDSTYHQFNIIGIEDYSREIEVRELLESEKITYLSHTVFLDNEIAAKEEWNLYEYSGLN